MCLAVYVSAPVPLPLRDWSDVDPGFYVEPADLADPVRGHFAWKQVVYVGSHEGCGCGFAYGAYGEDDDEAMRRASVRALREYVEALTWRGPVELYACWEGEQELPLAARIDASPESLGGTSFRFDQRTLWVFSAGAQA